MLNTCTIQDVVANRLESRMDSVTWLAGIVGENPSKYAKSPSIWNPVLQMLGLDAAYLPFDVETRQLPSFVEAIRHEERVKGFSVTMPYKVTILPLLDELDQKARSIGAVNVVVRTSEGKLIGANTDGSGWLASLTTPVSGEQEPFMPDLKDKNVLLIGAGGAGKALAWYLAEAIGGGALYLANRSQSTGEELCQALKQVNPRACWVDESAIESVASSVHLIINATTKGQSGLRTSPDASITCLEPYSSLAPASPARFSSSMAADGPRFFEAWFRASWPDVMGNLSRSSRILSRVASSVRIMDIIYAPLETSLLRQARLSGHRTLNGKGMNICQAADALFHWVFREHFEETGCYEPAQYRAIVDLMCEVW
jgi:shikimate dehydrogenase